MITSAVSGAAIRIVGVHHIGSPHHYHRYVLLRGLGVPLWNTHIGGAPESMSTDSSNSTLRTILLVIAVAVVETGRLNAYGP